MLLELIDILVRADKYRLLVVTLLTFGLPLIIWIQHSTRKQLLHKNSCTSVLSFSNTNILGNWSKIPFFVWFQTYQPCIIAVIHYMIGLSLMYRFYRFVCMCWRNRKHCHSNTQHPSCGDGGTTEHIHQPAQWNNPSFQPVTATGAVSRPFSVIHPTQMSPGNYHIRLFPCSQRKVTTLNKAPTVYFLSFDNETSLVQLMDGPKRWFLNRHSELNSENSTLRIEPQNGLGYMVTCALRNHNVNLTNNTREEDESDKRNHTKLCGSGLVLQTDGFITWGKDRVLCWVKPSNTDTPDEIAWKLPTTSTDFVPLKFAFVPLDCL